MPGRRPMALVALVVLAVATALTACSSPGRKAGGDSSAHPTTPATVATTVSPVVGAPTTGLPPGRAPTTGLPAGTTAPTTASSTPTVPVVGCPTTYGAGRPAARPAPGSEPAAVSATAAAQLSYYTTDTYGDPPVLGPRGWACTALVGADGSTTITAYRPGARVPQNPDGQQSVIARSASACQSCVWGAVCRFVPAAGAQLGYQTLHCPPAPAGETTYWIRGSSSSSVPLSDVVGSRTRPAPTPPTE